MAKGVKKVTEESHTTIECQREYSYIRKKGKKAINKDKNGNAGYQRHDVMGLLELLRGFDSKLHDMKDYKLWGKVTRKARAVMVEYDDGEKPIKLGFSLDEAKFIREFLKKFKKKDGKKAPSLSGAAIQALPDILDQLS